MTPVPFNSSDLALLFERGVDSVVRKHQLRFTDFRSGVRLGHDDHLVRWSKPDRPSWMSLEQYASLPDVLELRELRMRVTQRGFRSKIVLVITTLRDAEAFSADAIAELYRRRWQAELNLRSLKVVLQMDHLRCKNPHRVRNEIYMHLLAYNLIRRMMTLAANEIGTSAWQISFKGALQTLNNFLPSLTTCMPIDAGCATLVACLGAHTVGDRPDRYEPRRVKRRPKKYKFFRESRNSYKKRIR